MRPLLKTTHVKDEDLIAELNIAVTDEAERNSKLGLGTKAKAKIAQVERKTPKMDDPPIKVDSIEQLIKEMRALKADVAILRQEMTKKKDRASPSRGRARGGGPRQESPGAVICASKREEILLIVGNVEPVNILLIDAHRIQVRETTPGC